MTHDLFHLSVGHKGVGIYRAGNRKGWRAALERTYLGKPWQYTIKAGPVVFTVRWRRNGA
jgi:hypothetical protein